MRVPVVGSRGVPSIFGMLGVSEAEAKKKVVLCPAARASDDGREYPLAVKSIAILVSLLQSLLVRNSIGSILAPVAAA